MLTDKALGELAEGGAFEADQAPGLARETLRLRKEARALRRFLEGKGLWAEYQEKARAAPAGKAAGRAAGKPVGAPA